MRQLELIVKESSIDNRGAFAVGDILPDTFVIEYRGERIPKGEAERREGINDLTGVTYIFYLDDDTYLDGAVGGNESRFFNHSCNPNCRVVRSDGKILFYSKRQINEGEELTIDYAYDKDSRREQCKCGSNNCRGFINK